MLKRFTILALVGFAIMPQLSHGFTFLSGNRYYQKAGILDTSSPTRESPYGLDYYYSKTDTEPFTLSAQASGRWSGVKSYIPSTERLVGLNIDNSPRAEQCPPGPVPEPAAVFLVGLGLVGLGVYKRHFSSL
jgi:hypothetical protein